MDANTKRVTIQMAMTLIRRLYTGFILQCSISLQGESVRQNISLFSKLEQISKTQDEPIGRFYLFTNTLAELRIQILEATHAPRRTGLQ
jgi:hypothetical protein